MPTEVQNHINRLTMEVEGKVQNPLEDATVYINCAVYENGLLESPAKQTTKTIDLCADKKIHFIEKSIERTAMATDEENNEYGYMNGDCTADELKKFQPGSYVAKTRVFQTQEIRITKTRKPLSAKADNEKNIQKEKPKDSTDSKEVEEVKKEIKNEVILEKPKQRVNRLEQLQLNKEVGELQSTKHKQDTVNSAEEPPRKKRYLCRDIVIPAYGKLYKNEGLTYPSAKLHLDARSWNFQNSSNPDANAIAEIVYKTFRPRVAKERHVRLLFPPPYHPKEPEPEVQVQVVTPMEDKPEEIVEDVVKPSEEDENEDDPKLSKRGRKKRNWFQRMWRNLRGHFRANEHRDA